MSIAGGIPRIPVKFKGETSPRVVIQPAYRLTNGTYGGGGALVDARIIRQVEEDGRSYGQIMVSWEDSEAGGDYDMDVWGLISYEMDSATNKIRVTTDAIYDATANPQGFGYVISGTDRDGLHFHSGILNFSYTDPMPGMVVTGSTKLNASGGCQDCTCEPIRRPPPNTPSPAPPRPSRLRTRSTTPRSSAASRTPTATSARRRPASSAASCSLPNSTSATTTAAPTPPTAFPTPTSRSTTRSGSSSAWNAPSS